LTDSSLYRREDPNWVYIHFYPASIAAHTAAHKAKPSKSLFIGSILATHAIAGTQNHQAIIPFILLPVWAKVASTPKRIGGALFRIPPDSVRLAILMRFQQPLELRL
jgi:hypothetical protein